jgi:protein SCO1/2
VTASRPHLRTLALLAATMSMAACHTKPPTAPATQSYLVRGRVVATDPSSSEVSLNTEAIPDFMAPMTMAYRLLDPSALSELHPGDLITATLLADSDDAGVKNLRLKDIVIIAQGRPDYVPAVQYHIPTPGDIIPHFILTNQAGHKITLQQFHGKVLLMTFIYTRCPLSDYCPRMSQNFAQIDKALAADPALYAQTHLLSISFDPTYDTPAVLKSYGAAYTGRYSKETFDHWDFAAPSLADLPKFEQFFAVGVTPGPKGPSGPTLQHSLSTILVGKDGKILAFYPNNDWSPADVLAKIKAAA